MGALRIAVSGTVLGTSLVSTVQTTVRGHLNEVQSTIETAHKLRNIDVESEFLVEQIEHLILRIILHEIDTRPDVLSEFVLGDKLEGQFAARGLNTVGSAVIHTFDLTTRRARRRVGASRGIPLIPLVAVLVVADNVGPAPIGIKHNAALDCGASRGRAFLPCELRVRFALVLADLLGGGNGGESR